MSSDLPFSLDLSEDERKLVERNLRFGRSWEYLNQLLLELPLYPLLLLKLLREGIWINDLPRVNWGLELGGLESSSKYRVQSYFDPRFFPKTILLKEEYSEDQKREMIAELQSERETPKIIFKPDLGRVGKGVFVLENIEQLPIPLGRLPGDYLVQEFSDLPEEFGVFFYRENGAPKIFSINSKHFPTVLGSGEGRIRELLEETPRLKRFEESLSRRVDLDRIPSRNEVVKLSYIGNHAQGCVFCDRTELATKELTTALDAVTKSDPGFNYGRLDVKAESTEALQRGEFVVLEVNGVDSLTTAIFDPRYRLRDAYRILLAQYNLLIRLTKEQIDHNPSRYNPPGEGIPVVKTLREVARAEKVLEEQHQAVLKAGLR